MKSFISKNIESGRIEFIIDISIFPVVVAMKAAYALLDKAYFFFSRSEAWLLVQVTPKTWQEWDAEKFACEYSDELLAYSLRLRIEIDNKVIRETIVRRALDSYADLANTTPITSQPNGRLDYVLLWQEVYSDIANDHDQHDMDEVLAVINSQNAEDAREKKKLVINKLKDVKKNLSSK